MVIIWQNRWSMVVCVTFQYDEPWLKISHSDSVLVWHFQPGVYQIWMLHHLYIVKARSKYFDKIKEEPSFNKQRCIQREHCSEEADSFTTLATYSSRPVQCRWWNRWTEDINTFGWVFLVKNTYLGVVVKNCFKILNQQIVLHFTS